MFVSAILSVLFLHVMCMKEGLAFNYWQQNIEDTSWSWGHDDDSRILESAQQEYPAKLVPHSTTTTTPVPLNNESDPCEPYEPKMPDFRKNGRLSIQVKCYEYIWDIKHREEEKARKEQCRKKKGYLPVIPVIFGGRDTTLGEYPHMAAIGWKASVGGWVFMCGGTLISDRFVLTAAHCTSVSPALTTVDGVRPKIVRLGEKYLYNVVTTGHRADTDIRRIVTHPEYQSPMKYNDIALLELEKSIKVFNLTVQPACLWGHDDTTSLGKQASVTGWGAVKAGTVASKELQSAVVDIIDQGLCSQLTRPWYNRNWCGLKNQICGGKLEGGVDSCQGDSGGPLQVKINLPPTVKGKIYYVVGVISFGKGCARKNTPGIYTQVSKYIGWIESIVWSIKSEGTRIVPNITQC